MQTFRKRATGTRDRSASRRPDPRPKSQLATFQGQAVSPARSSASSFGNVPGEAMSRTPTECPLSIHSLEGQLWKEKPILGEPSALYSLQDPNVPIIRPNSPGFPQVV